MSERRFVAYYRVSTQQQGQSGLGLEAQRATVLGFLETMPGELILEFSEIESGRKARRPRLDEALKLCRIYRVTLIIAKLDRLSRNVALITRLMESGVSFVAADFPDANRLTVHVLATIAEYEAALISERIKAALAAAKARGVKLGSGKRFAPAAIRAGSDASAKARRAQALRRARDLAPVVWPMVAAGLSSPAIAKELSRLKIPTARGGAWRRDTVAAILARTSSEFADYPGVREALALSPRALGAKRRAVALAPQA